MNAWQTRIADKDQIPLTTAGFNAVVRATNTRLDDLDGMIARNELLQDMLVATPSLVDEIQSHRGPLKALFAQVKEDALFGIQTPLVGQQKDDEKLLHIRLPETYGEMIQRFDHGWQTMTDAHLPDYMELSEPGKAFAQQLFDQLTVEIFGELEKSLGDKRVRGV